MPVFSSIYKVLFQVNPPSIVLNIPLSLFFEYKCPKAATTISSGSLGFIITLPI